MADAVTPVVTAASAVATATAMTGAPPEMVLLAAVLGAAISLWSRKSAGAEFSLRWLGGAVGHFAVAVATGVVGSTMLMAIFPAVALLEPLTRAPQWTWSLALSGGTEFLLPFIGRVLNSKVPGSGQ